MTRGCGRGALFLHLDSELRLGEYLLASESKDSYAKWCLTVLIGVLLVGALIITVIAAVALTRRLTVAASSIGTDAYDYEPPVGGDSSEKGGLPDSPPSTPRSNTSAWREFDNGS
ncbi:hypothetical protein MTO96_017973 [Rhipicephalus appendiculatus]